MTNIRKTAILLTLTLGLSSLSCTTWAASSVGQGKAIGEESIAIGGGTERIAPQAAGMYNVAIGAYSSANGKENAISIGVRNISSAESATSIGTRSRAEAIYATALGYNCRAMGRGALAFGTTAFAQKVGTVALGFNSTASGEESISMGRHVDATGDYSVAIGPGLDFENHSLASGGRAVGIGYYVHAIGKDSTAVGSYSQALGANSLALGTDALAEHTDSIALGASSRTEAKHNTNNSASSITLGKTTYNFAADSAQYDYEGTVSIGTQYKERQLHNLASGEITATSTDGVNGSQLYAVADALNKSIDRATDIQNASVVDFTYTTNEKNGTTTVAYTKGDKSIGLLGTFSSSDYHLIANPETKDGKYHVADNKVDLLVKDNVSGTTKTVTIDNLASQEDITSLSKVKNTLSVGTQNDTQVQVDGSTGTITTGKVAITGGDTNTITGLSNTKWNHGNPTGYAPDRAATEGELKEAVSQAITHVHNDAVRIQEINTKEIKKLKTDIATGWDAQIDGKTVNTINPDQKAMNFKTGDNMVLTNDHGAIKISTSKNIALDTIKVGDKVVISHQGIDAGGTTITNAKAGTVAADSTDVVTGGQLYERDTAINQLGDGLNDLGNRVNKVGAGAAALAALKPLDFDPEDKWNLAAGFGHYRSANAVALGAFYRPDDRTVFSVSTTIGNGKNMLNAGVSLKLGKINHTTHTKAIMAQEIIDLRNTNKALANRLSAVEAKLNNLK